MAQPRSFPLFFISVATFFNATARKGIIAYQAYDANA
ncbi:hypothetical protein LTSEURB_3498, partial [Salmonella enterica subsp. enterica serovar Urbana str. R8-2977]